MRELASAWCMTCRATVLGKPIFKSLKASECGSWTFPKRSSIPASDSVRLPEIYWTTLDASFPSYRSLLRLVPLTCTSATSGEALCHHTDRHRRRAVAGQSNLRRLAAYFLVRPSGWIKVRFTGSSGVFSK